MNKVITRKKNFTTTLPIDVLDNLTKISKETGKGRNEILSEAFNTWYRKKEQAWVAEGYKQANKDPEYKSLPEEDIVEWGKGIEAWENSQ